VALDDRHIPLKGNKNFRDFGGYPTRCGHRVKRGVLFRSEGLWKLSDQDLEKLDPLGIRNIFDLRRQRERELMPTRWHENSSTKNHHLPLMPESGPSAVDQIRIKKQMQSDAEGARQVMIDLYLAMVVAEESLNNLRQIFLIIASEKEVPVLVHCSGGKDRTGVSCALILALLGVEKSEIMEDYMHSQALYSSKIDMSRAATQVFDHAESGDWNLDMVRPVYNVEPAYLESAFGHIQESYGDVENFLQQALGLRDKDIEQIKKNLLE